jgi:hypothetical protein
MAQVERIFEMTETIRDKEQAFPGFFELKTAENMLEKAKRELARLEAEESIDHVYNFFVTAYHIVDYLDERLSKQKIKRIKSRKWMHLCADACNKAKHMRLTHDRPDVETLTPFKGAVLNTGALNTFALNTSSVERWIRWHDGRALEVVTFARSVIAKWGELLDNQRNRE